MNFTARAAVPAAVREFRQQIREQRWSGDFSQVPSGFTMGTVIILPESLAADFIQFCVRNQKAAGLLQVSEVGDPCPGPMTPDVDIRTDLHSYRVFRHGELVETVSDISHLWREDFVTFTLGCSLTFEHAMTQAGVERGDGRVYQTTIPATPVGAFRTNLSVTMRAMTTPNVIRAIQVTSRFPATHGGPIHFGTPEAIGIEDMGAPVFGGAPTLGPDEIPVFWACSATAVDAAQAAAPDLMITFDPPYMLLTDVPVEATSIF